MSWNVAALSPAWLGLIGAVVVVYWSVPARLRAPVLIASCLAFLVVASPVSAVLVTLMGATAWMSGRITESRGLAITVLCVAIVALLAYLKVNSGGALSAASAVALPLGVSYYSFRCIHYVLERYKGTLPPHTFSEFSAYLLFLPTFAAGPIHRFPEFHRDFVEGRVDASNVSLAFERIVYGYAKIVIVANYIVGTLLVPYGNSLEAASPRAAEYVGTFAQYLNAYLQFAGYSDVAIGCAILLGYRVIENFDAPFLAVNIADFWRRWHISLTTWCREYIYTTIVSVSRRPALAALVTMLVIGLWHEVSWKYVLWGLWHGAGLAAWQVLQVGKRRIFGSRPVLPAPLGKALGFVLTFHFVLLSFTLLGEGTVGDGFDRLQLIVTGTP